MKKMNIKVDEETHGKIKTVGIFGEDYGDIVKRLVDYYIKREGLVHNPTKK